MLLGRTGVVLSCSLYACLSVLLSHRQPSEQRRPHILSAHLPRPAAAPCAPVANAVAAQTITYATTGVHGSQDLIDGHGSSTVSSLCMHKKHRRKWSGNCLWPTKLHWRAASLLGRLWVAKSQHLRAGRLGLGLCGLWMWRPCAPWKRAFNSRYLPYHARRSRSGVPCDHTVTLNVRNWKHMTQNIKLVCFLLFRCEGSGGCPQGAVPVGRGGARQEVRGVTPGEAGAAFAAARHPAPKPPLLPGQPST